MRSLVLASLAAALLAGCASTETTHYMQTPRVGPAHKALFPIENDLRDSVVLEWIGGASYNSYILAEPNGKSLSVVITKALNRSGLQAGTPVRARYGLRVTVEDADGPHVGGTARSHLRATYVLVERATGRELFRQTVDTDGKSVFIGLNETDLKLAWDISAPLVNAGLIVGAGGVLAEEIDDNESWSAQQWDDFWDGYRAYMVGAAVLGPVIVGAEFINPEHFVPFSSDVAAAKARAPRDLVNDFQYGDGSRSGRVRAAQAIYNAEAANVSGFLVALMKRENVMPTPIFPCHGSAKVEALKMKALAQGITFTTDDCAIPRSRFADGR